jgi:hypothetical protein
MQVKIRKKIQILINIKIEMPISNASFLILLSDACYYLKLGFPFITLSPPFSPPSLSPAYWHVSSGIEDIK